MRIFLYCAHDLRRWLDEGRRDLRPGLAPYGLEHLEGAGGKLIVWTPSRLARTRAAELAWRSLERTLRHPSRLAAMLGLSRERPDIALAVLEEEGYAHAILRAAGVRPWADVPLVLTACWMAERARIGSRREVEHLRRVALGTDLIVYWSTNQKPIFQEILGVRDEKLHFVPFGVETEFYRAGKGNEGLSSQYVLAAGRDAGRDYDTVVAAARDIDADIKIVAPVDMVKGVADAPNVTVLGEVTHERYRQLLWRASVVVIASDPALAYPTGQTVMINAMAVGTPTVVTATAPLMDYARDGENTLLVPAQDPGAMAAAVNALLTNDQLAASLARVAAADVASQYNTKAMWTSVARRMERLLADRAI